MVASIRCLARSPAGRHLSWTCLPHSCVTGATVELRTARKKAAPRLQLASTADVEQLSPLTLLEQYAQHVKLGDGARAVAEEAVRVRGVEGMRVGGSVAACCNHLGYLVALHPLCLHMRGGQFKMSVLDGIGRLVHWWDTLQNLGASLLLVLPNQWTGVWTPHLWLFVCSQALEESRGRGGAAPSFVDLALEEVAVEGYGPFR
jgi:hypothetical protein